VLPFNTDVIQWMIKKYKKERIVLCWLQSVNVCLLNDIEMKT
jgi:hypothetical protein